MLFVRVYYTDCCQDNNICRENLLALGAAIENASNCDLVIAPCNALKRLQPQTCAFSFITVDMKAVHISSTFMIVCAWIVAVDYGVHFKMSL